MAATANRSASEEREFHRCARAEAEREVHSRRVAGLVVALLLLVTGAYGLFVWQSDRAALSTDSLPKIIGR